MDIHVRPSSDQIDLPGLKVIRIKRFDDNRGFFTKPFSAEILARHGIKFDVNETFFSQSSANVLRGMHFQTHPHEHGKLICCVLGKILDVAVDLRVGSPAYGRAWSIRLDSKDPVILYLPPGLAHGFYSEADNALVAYWVDSAYSSAHDQGILWSSIDFKWPNQEPILSERDKAFPSLREFDSPFHYAGSAHGL